MIKLIRIDDRLVHGQVAYAWTGSIGADVILVANDKVVNDEFQKMTLKFATPSGVELLCKSMDDSIHYLNSKESEKNKVFVLVNNSTDALTLAEKVNDVEKINVGGMRMAQGKKMRTPAVALDDHDIANFKKILNGGVELEIRQVPSENIKRLEDLKI